MIPRLSNILLSQSFFLFGARGTGKTRLISQLFADQAVLKIDLLDFNQFETFSLNPSELEALVLGAKLGDNPWVFIDEVQRVPQLLDVVHRLIESRGIKFALSGSSARKLRRGGANLLAGRAFTYQLFPFTASELGVDFDIDRALHWGTLPTIYNLREDNERLAYLQSYVQTYLKEEIQAEQIVRSLAPFRKFLSVAAQTNGEIVNFSKIARDVGRSDTTVREYFQILEDTLLGFFLEPYHTSVRKRLRESPKFYLFDTGVQRALARRLTVALDVHGYSYGDAFEHLVILELYRHSVYARNDFEFFYLRTKDGVEIDLVVDRPGRPLALVEIKSTVNLREDQITGLKHFLDDFPEAEFYCLSQDSRPKRYEKIQCLPWQEGVRQIVYP